MKTSPFYGAATALLFIAAPAAAEFSAIGESCAVELGRAAQVEQFADLKALYDATRDEGDDPARDVAQATAELCPGTCVAGQAFDIRNGIGIHLVIPDEKGGAALLRDMGWIGGASACSIGEPTVKGLGGGLYQVTVDERTGEFQGDEGEYCANEETARSELLLDLSQKRWLVWATALGKGDELTFDSGRVRAKACGRTLDASVAALKAGEAMLDGDGPAAKAAPAAATVKLCEKDWPAAAKVDRNQTWACLTHYLTYAYGQKPTAELMTLDPGYGHPVEVKLSVADLERMTNHVEAACDVAAAPVESECARGHELFQGMKHRRLGISEGVELGSFEPLLRKVLAGEELTEADLLVNDTGPKWSLLTLWKLRNAAYARHGYLFKTPDLNTFFYGPREPVGEPKLLPLAKKGETKKVTLSKADTANVRLIKLMEGRGKAR